MATMSQEEVDAWLGAHGGGQLQHGIEKKQVRNPNYNEVKGPTPSNPEFITIDVETWTNSKTGAKLVAQHLPDGSWERHDAVEGDPNKPGADTKKTPPGGKPYIDDGPEAGKTGRRWGWNPETGAYDRDIGSSPAAQAAEQGQSKRDPVKDHPGYVYVTTTKNGQTESHYEKEDAPGVPVPAPQTPQKPTPQQGPGGQWGYWDTTPGQQPKWVPIQGGPAEAQKPVQVNGKWGYWQAGTDGVPKWVEIQGPQEQQVPAGMPRFTPDKAKPGLGVYEYRDQLLALRNANKLTEQQFLQYVQLAQQDALAEAKRLDMEVQGEQQQQTNAVNQRQTDINASLNRLNASNTATQNALDTSLKMASNFTPSSYAAAGGPILPAVLALQDMRANQWGGMYQPPQVTAQGYPALPQVPTNPNTVIPAVSALTAPQQPAAPSTPPPPNAIGAGSIGSVGAPGAATPVARPAPIFTPQPVAPPPVPYTPQPAVTQTDPQAMAQPPVLPAVNTLGIMASLGHKYSPEVLQQAAAELGWL